MFHPNRAFQAGLNQQEARHVREKNNLSLRRKDREEKLQNKRKQILNGNKYKAAINLNGLSSFNDPMNTHKAIVKIRESLSIDDPNATIQQIIHTGTLSHIVSLLQINNSNIVYETCSCIVNIVSEDSTHTSEYIANVVRSGALIPLLNILTVPKYSVQERALCAIGNIAGESEELRDTILKCNILQILIKIIKKPFDIDRYYDYKYDDDIPDTTYGQYLELITTLSWTIANLCRDKANDNDDENVKYKLFLIECIYHLIKIKNKFESSERNKININICWSIQYLLPMDYKCPTKLLKYLDELNILKHLICLLNQTTIKSVYRPIIRIITILLTGDNTNDDSYTQMCVHYGILKPFHILLNKLINNNDSTSLKILSDVCLSISKINTCFQFINSVMDTNLFSIVCKLLVKQSTVSNSALYAVANAIDTANKNNNTNIIQHLCYEHKCNLIKYLCDYNKMIFMNGNWEKKMEKRLKISLDCMENIFLNGKLYAAIFEEYNGLHFLEYMETVNNLSELLYDRIMIIKNEYFGYEKDTQPDTQQNYMNNNFDRMEISFDNINRQM